MGNRLRMERSGVFLFILLCCHGGLSVGEVNKRPIIGIVSQTIHPELDAMLPPGHNYTTYIASSYIKWVEAAGARAVPVIVENEITSPEYFAKLFSSINGLLIPVEQSLSTTLAM